VNPDAKPFEIRAVMPDGSTRLIVVLHAANEKAALAQYRYEWDPHEPRKLIAVRRE
jgi:hypothetical protein